MVFDVRCHFLLLQCEAAMLALDRELMTPCIVLGGSVERKFVPTAVLAEHHPPAARTHVVKQVPPLHLRCAISQLAIHEAEGALQLVGLNIVQIYHSLAARWKILEPDLQ